MIDFKGKNTPELSDHLRSLGFRVGMHNGHPAGMDMAGNKNPGIDALVQRIIDDFDPLVAVQAAALSEVDQIEKDQPWRPSPQDMMRLADAKAYIMDGKPENLDGQYRWLESAAKSQGMTMDGMADYIASKSDEAFSREQARLDVKAAIRDAGTADQVRSILLGYRQRITG